MSIKYRYYGLLHPGRTNDNPSGIVRVWTDEEGCYREETYSYELKWVPADLFSPMQRPSEFEPEIVEIDEAVVGPFIERINKLHGPGGIYA